MTFAKAVTFVLAVSILLPIQSVAAASSPASENEPGRRIYTEGVLPSGAELSAVRFGNAVVSGELAACVNCHRPSGMGTVEGDVQVPPITGNYLFGTGDDKLVATMDPRISKRFNQTHLPYTDETLAAALRSGISNQGNKMNALMPRYPQLNKADMKVLTAYLRQLNARWSPGVAEDSIRLATVITPEVEPARRKVFLDMLRIAVFQKNASTMTAKHVGTKRKHMISAAEMILGTERNWQMDVWELQGPQETWGEQLAAKYRAQPVFALVSGLSNSSWQPVHDFCEQENVPCWFPSVDLPVLTESPNVLYFSRGVVLEAEVLARYLKDQGKDTRHLVQIYRDNDVGQAASSALKQALAGSSVVVEACKLDAAGDVSNALGVALGSTRENDIVMFWLRPDDLAVLDRSKPVSGAHYFFSAHLGNTEHRAYPADWKNVSKLIYPYELPTQREINQTYFRAWLNMSKLPLVDEAMQSEVFFAMNYLTDTVSEMLNNMYRDYLLERAENMLNKREGSKAEQESRDRLALGRPGEMTRRWGKPTIEEGSRIQITSDPAGKVSKGTTAYPRLSLAPGQRFASKGAYIVHLGEDNKVLADSEWIVP